MYRLTNPSETHISITATNAYGAVELAPGKSVVVDERTARYAVMTFEFLTMLEVEEIEKVEKPIVEAKPSKAKVTKPKLGKRKR